jgi:hypothetical protein
VRSWSVAGRALSALTVCGVGLLWPSSASAAQNVHCPRTGGATEIALTYTKGATGEPTPSAAFAKFLRRDHGLLPRTLGMWHHTSKNVFVNTGNYGNIIDVITFSLTDGFYVVVQIRQSCSTQGAFG